MNLKKLLLIPFSLTILLNCSSSKEIPNSESPPSRSIPKITSSANLKISIPEGWYEIEDNMNKLFEIWLVNVNNNASICFLPISLNIHSESENRLELVKKIVLEKKIRDNLNLELISNDKISNGKSGLSFIYSINGNIQSSIIFGNGNHYYECLAYFENDYDESDSERKNIFEIQENVVRKSEIK